MLEVGGWVIWVNYRFHVSGHNSDSNISAKHVNVIVKCLMHKKKSLLFFIKELPDICLISYVSHHNEGTSRTHTQKNTAILC